MRRPPLVLISGKDPMAQVGGHESYVRAHALAAERLGFEPHVLAVGRRTETVTTGFGVLHRVAAPPRGRTPVAAQVPLLAQAAVRLLDGRPGPHVVHGFAIWSASAVAAARTLVGRGRSAVPVASAYGTRVFEITAMQAGLGPHLSAAERRRYRAWLRWASLVDDRIEGWGYAGARAVLVNYDSVRRILTAAYGPSLAIRRIAYASDASFDDHDAEAEGPTARVRQDEPPRVLAVSRHDPRKGLDVLLHALAGVAGMGIAFQAALLGSGRLLDADRRLATQLGLNDRVDIPGRVSDATPYLRSADVFVLPSRAEASGSVSVLEALRTGTAVVASACDGIPEDLTDGRDALLVPPGDTDALRAALAELLLDPRRRTALATAGRALHDERFSAARLTGALAAVYAEIAAAPAGSRLPQTAAAT